ncbi:TonB dependent receptor [compost metagenome]
MPNQTSVDSFTTVNAFVAYTLPDQGWSKGSQLTLNIDNVFDEDPPYFNSPTGYANGQTLGRVFTLGIRKAF